MFTPDLLTFPDGTPVTTPAQWQKRRRELLSILEREEYGIRPAFTGCAQGALQEIVSPCCAGHARHDRLVISFDTPSGAFSFPLQLLYPADGRPHQLLLSLSFQSDVYNAYTPVEEIIDNGFALAHLCYTDVTSDDADMSSGLAGCYPRRDPATDWGKLSMWGFAASRAADYLATHPAVDPQNMAVIGHSRLGKAALLCGALDERFRFVLANNAGCGGDALEQTKHPGAETIAVMAGAFPFWFCGNRSKYAANPSHMPFDQHFLMAAIAPRFVAVCSAEQDTWADPYSQQLCCVAASPAWALHRLHGFVGPQEPATVPAEYAEGHIAYRIRDGVHFLSRKDWLYYMDFIRKHMAPQTQTCV